MNLAVTYTTDAIRRNEEDLKALQAEEERLEARKGILLIRRADLQAQLEFHKQNPTLR